MRQNGAQCCEGDVCTLHALATSNFPAGSRCVAANGEEKVRVLEAQVKVPGVSRPVLDDQLLQWLATKTASMDVKGLLEQENAMLVDRGMPLAAVNGPV